MEKSNYKYQYSCFIGGGKAEQLVIRSDSWEEFKKMRKRIDKILGKRRVEQPEPPWMNQRQPNEPLPMIAKGFCSIHNLQMTERTGKDGSRFYSHGRKNADGAYSWCSGKGFKEPSGGVQAYQRPRSPQQTEGGG